VVTAWTMQGPAFVDMSRVLIDITRSVKIN
jgi:hypothetical protein